MISRQAFIDYARKQPRPQSRVGLFQQQRQAGRIFSLTVGENFQVLRQGTGVGPLKSTRLFSTTPSAYTVARVFDAVFHLAVRAQISVYDAAYLELAIREGLPLASLDRTLRSAAEQFGVELA